MTSSQENGKISMATDGMNYAPAPMPKPVVEPGDFEILVGPDSSDARLLASTVTVTA